jgi:replicative DNA helicase
MFRDMDDVRSGKKASMLTRTGLHRLDAQLGGGLAPEPYLVAGRPGMGKSAFALCVGRNIAAGRGENEPGKAVIFLSAEMSERQLAMRLAALESKVEVVRSNNPRELDPEEYVGLQAGAERARKLPFFFWKKAQPKVLDLRSAAREGLRMLRRKHGAGLELGLIIIDYIQVLDGQKGKGENREQEVRRLSQQIQLGMAGDFGCPVMTLSQLSRDCEKRPDKRPEKADLRDSGALEQDAYGIIMLYRDEVYFPNTPDQGVAECLVRKNRNGDEGTAKVAFHGAWTMFDNLPGTY